MGMFDDLTVEYPLPDPQAQHINFQTKSLYNTMSHYILTKEGRLVEEIWDTEMTPQAEKPYPDAPEGSMQFLFGCIRRVEGSQRFIDLNYEGSLLFYGDAQTGELMVINIQTGEDSEHPGPRPEWFEYLALFWEGNLIKLKRLENRNP